jgi:threonylcarbamoyladenosine tRNA methylthiotransferase MtaB
MQKFYVSTMGCKINQYESEALAEAWSARGLVESCVPEDAQVLLVNSCAVTSRSVRDLRALVRRLRKVNKGARLVVTGCAAQVLREELAAMPEVDLVLPQDRKPQLLADPFISFGASLAAESLQAAVPIAFPRFEISAFNRARAVVKVQDGCSHGCTYCIVPLTRGPSVSRAPDEILAEVRRLLDAGYRELVISGVNLRQYGRDFAEPLDFWDLLAGIEREFAPEWAGRARLRLSSVEPGQLDAKALDVLCAARLVAPHLHLSLQSGDPEVLRRMGRGHYRPEQVLEFLAKLRQAWPRLGLGADLLTGFPGETEAQFTNSYAFCRELPLTYAHVFPYSPRPGTPAALWPDALSKAERTSRAARLRGLAESRKRSFLKTLTGLPQLTVLLEKGAGQRQGVCEFYAPCLVRGEGLKPGSLVPMRPEGVEGGRIVGSVILKDSGADAERKGEGA